MISYSLALENITLPLPRQVDTTQWLQQSVYAIAALLLARGVSIGIYRLYFSPLAKIPGPRLAGETPSTLPVADGNSYSHTALTYWYEAYYDVWLGGQGFRAIDRMHERYGPIIRINPSEVHFDDADFLETLYPGAGRKTGKPAMVASRTGTPESLVATVDHDMHRRRRNCISPFFSSASIRRLEPIMETHMEILLSRLEEAADSGKILAMHHVFKACTSDVITHYAFGETMHFVEDPDFGRPYFEATEMFHALTHVFGHFQWLAALIQSAPQWFIRWIIPSLDELWEKQRWWLQKVHEIRNSPNPERIKNTIFEGILSSNLPPEDKTDERLASEAQLVVFAGEGTTAYTLTSALYHLLANPDVLQKVKEELIQKLPPNSKIPPGSFYDSMPYMKAVIQEVMRLHPGVMNRQVRTSPELPIKYVDNQTGKEYVLPPGTTYSISPLTTQMNPRIFEHPYEFYPERWIQNPSLSRAFMSFSKGARSCLGMNLAKREMFTILSTLLLKYNIYSGQGGPTLELYDTKRDRDIDANSDYIIPSPAKGSKGLQLRVRH